MGTADERINKRLEERRAELAIRAALGARGRHLVSAVAREVLQSAVIGAAAGALIAWVGIRFIQTHAVWDFEAFSQWFEAVRSDVPGPGT